MLRMKVIHDDITCTSSDVMVCPYAPDLGLAEGIALAIQKAAGIGLQAELNDVQQGKVGVSFLTGAYRLPTRHLIHVVVPELMDGEHGDASELVSCYRSMLDWLADSECHSLVLPPLGALKGFAIQHEAAIAVQTIRDYAEHHPSLIQVVFCTTSLSDYGAYSRELCQLRQQPGLQERLPQSLNNMLEMETAE